MTIQEAKNKLVAWCNQQVGYCEGGSNWNKYAEGRYSAYGWNVQNQPWCDIFTDVGFIENFGLDNASAMTYQPIGAFSAACRISADYFKNNAAFSQKPEVGDVIFFYVDGGINHQGIVVKVSGGVVSTIEGNSSDRVCNRAYAIGSSNIAGYGRPKWDIFTGGDPETVPGTPEPVSKSAKVEMVVPFLSPGDTGPYVKIAQILLMKDGQTLPRWGADGEFGDETRNAVERFQKKHELVINSIVDEATWKALGA